MLYIWPYVALFSAPILIGPLYCCVANLLPSITGTKVGMRQKSRYPVYPDLLQAIVFISAGLLAVHFNTIETEYQAPFIRDALARYVVRFNHPDYTDARVERESAAVNFPFRTLPIYHKAKLWLGSKSHHRLMADEWDVIHARNARIDTRGRPVNGRFDTVLVNTGEGEYTGIQGKCYKFNHISNF